MIRFFVVVFISLLSACNSVPPVQFYVLEPLSQTTSTPVETVISQSIGIGPISIPVLLEHKQIVTRTSGNTVQLAEFQQWASPLQDNLLQTLSQNVANLQPNHIVRTYPWSIHGTVDLQVIVDFIRFDTTRGQSANLEANWTIKNENSNNILKNGHTTINHALADSSYSGTVHALNKLLAAFSQELSLALLKLELAQ